MSRIRVADINRKDAMDMVAHAISDALGREELLKPRLKVPRWMITVAAADVLATPYGFGTPPIKEDGTAVPHDAANAIDACVAFDAQLMRVRKLEKRAKRTRHRLRDARKELARLADLIGTPGE